MIAISDLNDSYTAHMRDLAVGGALIEPQYNYDAQIGQELLLTIPFGLKEDHINIKAVVAWTKPNGIGVKFITSVTENRIFR